MRTILILTTLGSLILGGCTIGPEFRKPDITPPAVFKNSTATINPKSITPTSPHHIGLWWQVFGDDRLNQLETAALDHSLQIAAALARVNQARGQFGVASADRLPTLNNATQIQVAGESSAQWIPSSNQNLQTSGKIYYVPFAASYEIDLWGRVRRSVESARADLTASEADQLGVLLVLTTDIARYYYSLRELNVELYMVSETVKNRQEAVAVNESRYRAGLATNLDVQRARVEAATIEADVSDLRRKREQAVNALAVATGAAPSEFETITDETTLCEPPVIPAGIPSQLLARRPDITFAEAKLHARTADIGVAIANRLPNIQITGTAGFVSINLRTLLDPASQFWNIGPSITIPIFDGGRRKSKEDQSRAIAAEALAEYRQSALVAYREVEDELVALREESVQFVANEKALVAANATSEIARKRYEKGLANYIEVTDAERTMLQIERSQAQLSGARYASTVSLIKAIGGSWNED